MVIHDYCSEQSAADAFEVPEASHAYSAVSGVSLSSVKGRFSLEFEDNTVCHVCLSYLVLSGNLKVYPRCPRAIITQQSGSMTHCDLIQYIEARRVVQCVGHIITPHTGTKWP